MSSGSGSRCSLCGTATLLFSRHLLLVNSRRPGHAVQGADSANGGQRPQQRRRLRVRGHTERKFWPCPTRSSLGSSSSWSLSRSDSGRRSWSAASSRSIARRPPAPPPTACSPRRAPSRRTSSSRPRTRPSRWPSQRRSTPASAARSSSATRAASTRRTSSSTRRPPS